MSEDKIELTEEMVNTLENPPKANNAFKAAAKKYKGEDIKMADGRVFDTWQKTECDECSCEFQITRTASKTVFGPVLCDECILYAKFDQEKYKLTQQVAELRAALLSIKNRQQVLTPSGFEFSSAWQVANKALEESE